MERHARVWLGIGVIALLLTASACGDGTRSPVQGSPEAGGRVSEEGSDGLVYLAPTYVPEGLELRSSSLQPERQEPGAYAAKLGRREDADEYTALITVLAQEAETDRDVGEDEQTTTINGREARIGEDLFGAGVDWFESGLSVMIQGPRDSRDLAVEMARRLEVPESGDPADVEIPWIPDGYEIIAEGAHPRTTSRGYSLCFMSTEGQEPRWLDLFVSLVPEGGYRPILLVAGFEPLRSTTLRGSEAAVSVTSGPGGTQIASVAWLEEPDVIAAISGGGLTEEEIVDFVEGLERVSEEEWRERVPPPDESGSSAPPSPE